MMVGPWTQTVRYQLEIMEGLKWELSLIIFYFGKNHSHILEKNIPLIHTVSTVLLN